MPRFFLNYIDKENPRIIGDDAWHIARSLRMKVGENITLCCDNIDYSCDIISITDDEVCLSINESNRSLSEPNIDVTLFQAVPKMDKLEYIIQKSVELGVSRIVPVLTKRCISRPTEKDFSKKLVRLNKISEQAAKQAGRGIIPEVLPIITFNDALKKLETIDKSIVLYEKQGTGFSDIDFKMIKTIGLFIGSEGGFDKQEIETLISAGAIPVWLGHRILRCETAPITALSILMFLTKNL